LSETTLIYEIHALPRKSVRLYRVLRFEYNDGIVFGVVLVVDPDEIYPLHDFTYFYIFLN
jgi:hypothetical protein